jgi:hypothetical protein
MDNGIYSTGDSSQIVQEFFGDDGQRKAYIIKDDQGFKVSCYELNEDKVMTMNRLINLPTKSLYYAQDTAENWVTYIIRNQ